MFEEILNIHVDSLIDFDDLFTLPYSAKDCPVYGLRLDVVDKLEMIHLFMELHDLDDVYYDSDLRVEIKSIINDYNKDDLLANIAVKNKLLEILCFFIEDVAPCIAPYRTKFWADSDKRNAGFYTELPGYEMLDHKEKLETMTLIQESSIFVKLFFIQENRASHLLEKTQPEALDNLCLEIIEKPHFTPLRDIVERVNKYPGSYAHKGEFLTTCEYGIVNWVIEKLFLDDYKHDIDSFLGSDLSRLFGNVIAAIGHGCDFDIDGIDPEDIYLLRESCPECENFEFESKRYDNKDCSCSNEWHNVWAITDFHFYKKLEHQGAMVYETDSLYLYLQTDFGGYYNDSLLRKAWLTASKYTIDSVLEKSSVDF